MSLGPRPLSRDESEPVGRVDESVPGVRETVQGLLDMARGLGLANVLTDDTARRARVVAQWSRILDAALV